MENACYFTELLRESSASLVLRHCGQQFPGLMKMTACLHLAAFCASLLLFGSAVSAAVKESLFYNTGRDNYLFQNDVLFDSVVSWSPLGCARLCSSDDRCRAFTRIPGSSGSGSCRGHSVTMTSASTDVTPASGAKTYNLAGIFGEYF